MKREKTCAILYFISSFCFYISAIINFVGHGDASKGVVWLCLGTTMLCIGSMWLNKSKKSEEGNEEK